MKLLTRILVSLIKRIRPDMAKTRKSTPKTEATPAPETPHSENDRFDVNIYSGVEVSLVAAEKDRAVKFVKDIYDTNRHNSFLKKHLPGIIKNFRPVNITDGEEFIVITLITPPTDESQS